MATASNTQNQQDPTPPEAEKTGITPPQAEKMGTTQAAAGNAADANESVEDIVKRRLDRARKQWDAEQVEAAAEAKRKAEQSAEERAREAEERAEKALADAEARVKAAERRASLAGAVTNPERVMRLMDNPDDYFDENGKPLNEKILTDFSEYAPKETGTSPVSSVRPARGPVTNPWVKETRNLTEQARIIRENPDLAAQLKQDAAN